MIKKFFTLLCLCTLCIGSAWGETYTISFAKGTTNGTNISTQLNSQATTTICSSGGDNISSYSSTNCYYATNGCGIRLAKSGGAGSLTLTFSEAIKNANVKEVIIYASAVASGNTLDVTPAGTVTTKTTFSSLSTYSTSAEINTYAQSAISINGTLTSLTFGATSKKYVHLHQIDIVTSSTPSTEPSLSVSPATIDFGTVYQNATVDAEDVTVTFANLTTNDVAAAITGSAFGINKTGSFTSGDKITITPSTANLGEYSETLTVSATGVESKEVTIKMNVIPAPVTKNYTLVTDASTLKDGNVIVLGAVKDDNWYVNGGINGKYLDSKDATCEDGILESSDAVEITLKETTGGWYLKIGETYINTTAEKALTFADEASTAWTISIDENGDATIAAGDNGRFLYNATSPRFLNYTSKTSASMLLPQIYRKEVSAKITSTGYATFSSDYALNLSNLPEGLSAYKATTAGNGKVHMVAVEEAVAANTGLFLKGAAGKTYTIPVTASGNALEGNLLKATTGESLAEGDYVYVISSGAFQPLGKATVVSKGKAYIPASAITTSGKLEISFDDPTGINNVANVKAADSKMYNLQGVQVSKNYNGIVIMNGKKYINK